MRAVNLLPKDAGRGRARRPLGRVALVGVLGTAVVVTGLAVGFLGANGAVEEKRAELERVRVQLAVTPRPARANTASSNGKLADERAKRASALGSALADRVSWDRLLRRFSLVLPGDVWLTTLSGTAPNAAGAASPTSGTASSGGSSRGGTASGASPTGAPTGFTLQGYAYSHEGVARLISRLDALPELKNVQLQKSELTELAGREVVQFGVLADVRTGEASR